VFAAVEEADDLRESMRSWEKCPHLSRTIKAPDCQGMTCAESGVQSQEVSIHYAIAGRECGNDLSGSSRPVDPEYLSGVDVASAGMPCD